MLKTPLATAVVQSGGSIQPLIIPPNTTNGTGLMNPSIFVDEDTLLLILRHVNYTLYHAENSQLFLNRWGPLVYLNPENDAHLKTVNYYCELNKNLNITKFHKIDTTTLDIPPVWEFHGLEDARIFRWDGHLYICGVRRDVKDNGEGRMELSEIEVTSDGVKEISRNRIAPPDGQETYCEKNWMPILDMPYHFIRWTNPTEIVKVDLKTNTSTIVTSKTAYNSTTNMRGGSPVITYKNKRICITHEVDLFKNKLSQKDAKYTHRFVVWDMDWNIEYVSDEFSFMFGEIEFCIGLALHNNEFLIPFGFQDNAAFILKVPAKFIDENILKNSKPVNKLNGFPRVNCTSYKASARIPSFKQQLEKHGITNYKITDDYDGRKENFLNHPLVEGSFFTQMCSADIAKNMTDIKSIKQWYEETDEPYGFFCEDDVTFDTVDYWNFKWEDFVKKLPANWKVIQLCLIKDDPITELDMKFSVRKERSWGASAYIITREYAKEMLDKHLKGDKYAFYSKYLIPFYENVVYKNDDPNMYIVPLFTEDSSFKSSFYPEFSKDEHKGLRQQNVTFILDWWKNTRNAQQLEFLFDFAWGDIKKHNFFYSIARKEFEEKPYERFFEVQKGDVVVDVGASVGPFTYSIMNKQPRQVYCLEPQKSLFSTLTYNLGNNSNVTLINKGISEIDGEVNFPNMLNIKVVDEANPILADSTTWNTFLSNYNIKKIDFLKLDCEGGEYDIFKPENYDWIRKNVDKIAGEFDLRGESKEKFRKFRDEFLSHSKKYEIFSWDGVDIKWDLWNEHFLEYYKDVYVYIDNKVKKNYWKTTPYPTLEFTTSVPKNGCVVDCAFCPQRTLVKSYSAETMMPYYTFVNIINKIPQDIRITFSGFVEPWINKYCTDMLLYAHNKGHEIAVFTTGIGMDIEDVRAIKHIPFSKGPNGGFCLHLPDQERIALHPITPKYIEVLEYFASVQNQIQGFYTMCMGDEVHESIRHIFPKAHKPEFWSRAGNLLGEALIKPELEKVKDRFKHMDHGDKKMTCGCVEDLYHNVVLPNGDVSLCCMDYSLKHIIGNILTQEYDDIIPQPNTPFSLCQTCENGRNVL